MDEKLKQKWVKALRSGKYHQAREFLRGYAWREDRWDEEIADYIYVDAEGNRVEEDAVGHCCLGVLCEITPGIEWEGSHFVVTSMKLKKLFVGRSEESFDWADDPETTDIKDNKVFIQGEDIPKPLADYFGLNKRVQQQGERKTLQSKLIDLNDNGTPFRKIADYIEKVL